MRPRQRWHYSQDADVLRLAASLLFGIVKNHAFEQGNKRTGTLERDSVRKTRSGIPVWVSM
jgi:prophage maintenance system killer protein